MVQYLSVVFLHMANRLCLLNEVLNMISPFVLHYK